MNNQDAASTSAASITTVNAGKEIELVAIGSASSTLPKDLETNVSNNDGDQAKPDKDKRGYIMKAFLFIIVLLIVFAGLVTAIILLTPKQTPIKTGTSLPALTAPTAYSPIRGVNLGGWLVLEPWITPSLFRPYLNITGGPPVDEYTLTKLLGKEQSLKLLQAHWDTWVSESDIEFLAGVGITHVRVPIGYWAVDLLDSEPFVQGQITYLNRLVGWAAKHGIMVVLDLHGARGSQNGFDNSGRRGPVLWQTNPQYVERTLEALRILGTTYMNQSSVVIIEALNEPAIWALDKSQVIKFYDGSKNLILDLNSKAANLTNISSSLPNPRYTLMLHDAFLPLSQWADFAVGTLLDTHIYEVFTSTIYLSPASHISRICTDIKSSIQKSLRQSTPTITGEWSLAITDCAYWLNGVDADGGSTSRWEGSISGYARQGSCSGINDTTSAVWNDDTVGFLKKFGRAQMEAYESGGGWFFWNFKTESEVEWDFMKLVKLGILEVGGGNGGGKVCA
ncbi:exo-1,3-beta-glucanase [Blyttiomyces sp. JEL0837]|nr:exo-1,3-beta-glucanase [Blyttiomyces sp. JEL0837]